MSRLRALGLLLLALFTVVAGAAQAAPSPAGRRVALIIGISDYKNWASLKNPSGDAEMIAKRLRAVGFRPNDVVLADDDVTKSKLEDTVRGFLDQARGADLVLIYYTGHGAVVDGKSYIVPKDSADPGSLNKSNVAFNAVSVDALIDAAEIGVAGVVLIDACRDRVGGDNAKDGAKNAGYSGVVLSNARARRGVIVQMATEQNKPAYDGKGAHSLYAQALDKYLKMTDLEIRQLLTKVEEDVFSQDDRQRPNVVSNGLRPDAYLTLGLNPQPGARSQAQMEGERAKDEATWRVVSTGKDAATYQAYLAQFPHGAHVEEAQEFLKTSAAAVATSGARETAQAALAAVNPVDWQSRDPETLAAQVLDAKATPAAIGELAQAGDARAMVILAALLDTGGGGLAADPGQALELYQRAAQKGDHVAERKLGDFLRYGRDGLARADAEASRHYAAAAMANDMVAQDRLGMMHASGLLGADKVNGAVAYYEPAAQGGYGWAQCHLADAYSTGKLGLPVDDLKAFALADRAAKQGNPCGKMLLASMYLNGLNRLPQNVVTAATLYSEAAGQGYAPALTALGLLYAQGLGVPADPVRAGQAFETAAAKGYAQAQFFLGLGYLKGAYGRPQDAKQAVDLFQQAASQGYPSALAALGWAYSEGAGGLPADQDRALRLIRQAADVSDPDGLYRLGFMNAEGRGTPKNPAEAQRLMKQAAGQGYGPAIKWLEASSGS